LDIWINNAGAVVRKPLLDVSGDEWDRVMNVNLRAVWQCGVLAARHMRQHGGGVIVNASSFGSRIPIAGNAPYAASKFALNGLTQAMAAEFAADRIRVFAYIPGMIDTDMTAGRLSSPEVRTRLAGQAVLNRLGAPEDLAPIIVMLTSELAGYLTGVTVEISGGKFCVQNPLYAWQ
jgi:3-oxoacyl-[acyl-carrier protein] reductase